MAKKGAAVTLWRRSAGLMVAIIAIGFGTVFARLFYLQVNMAEELQRKAVEQQLHDSTVSAKRGSIYDSGGNILAQSITVWDVVLAPNNFKDADEATRKAVAYGLAEIVGVDKQKVFESTKAKSYYEIVKRKVEADVKDKVVAFTQKMYDEYKVSGVIELQENYRRYYTHDNFAAAILGFVGADNQGLAGVEYQYEDELKGDPGRIVVAQNALNNPMPGQYEQKIEATDGYDVILTIDENIQSIMEKYVRETLKEFNVANRGCAIMIEVKTGRILGFACEESFNPNDPFTVADEKQITAIEALPKEKQAEAESAALSRQWRNKGVSDTYVPGSVFKMVTASAVLSEGLIDKDTRFTCTGSYAPYEGASPITCWNLYGHGTQTLAQALCNSCNPAFMQMGFMLGRKNLYEYFVAFGFNEKTGIDLPGESDSYWFNTAGGEYGMGLMDLAVGSFGQNFKVTPIQMVTAAAAIANGGMLMQPYVVDQVVDSNGNVVKSNEPIEKRQVISKSIAREMCDILETNAKSGGATNGYVAGYRIGGKTGTSQKKVDENGNATEDEYIASYCGIAPCDDPEVALLCYFDTPDTSINYYGTTVAGPCFRKIMTEALPYLGIEKIYTDDELSKLDTIAGSYEGMSVDEAKSEVEKAKLKAEVVGEGDTVIAQNPSAYSNMPTDGTVILYTDEASRGKKVKVPDFKNCTLNDVNYLASINDLNICIVGSSISDSTSFVKSQDIAAGTEVEPFTVVTVTFNQDNSIM